MGFFIDYRKRVAQQFSLSVDETNELLKRMHGHYKKNGISHEEIAKSFFVLRNIVHRKEDQKLKTSVPQLNFKNKGIEKYKIEIVKFLDKGISTTKIFEAIKLKKNAPSLSTIKRYIKAFNDWRNNNG